MQLIPIILSTQILHQVVRGDGNPIQNCLEHFPTTEYQFVNVDPSEKAMKCITAVNKTDFEENCPDKQVIVTDKYVLKMKTEVVPDELAFFSRHFIYEEHPPEVFIHQINIAEHLEMNTSYCLNIKSPWTSVIMQVLHYYSH